MKRAFLEQRAHFEKAFAELYFAQNRGWIDQQPLGVANLILALRVRKRLQDFSGGYVLLRGRCCAGDVASFNICISPPLILRFSLVIEPTAVTAKPLIGGTSCKHIPALSANRLGLGVHQRLPQIVVLVTTAGHNSMPLQAVALFFIRI